MTPGDAQFIPVPGGYVTATRDPMALVWTAEYRGKTYGPADTLAGLTVMLWQEPS